MPYVINKSRISTHENRDNSYNPYNLEAKPITKEFHENSVPISALFNFTIISKSCYREKLLR